MIIYRYFSDIKHVYEFFSEKQLRKSRSNDPYDNILNSLYLDRNDNFKSMAGDVINYKELHEQYLPMICFSEFPDNLLMWSHYGKYGNGVVVGFDIKNFKLNEKFLLKKVKYKEIRPIVKEEYVLNADLISLLHIKPKCWEYESEYRLIIDGEGESEFIKLDELIQNNIIPKELILGWKFGKKEVDDKICELCINNNLKLFIVDPFGYPEYKLTMGTIHF